MSTLITAALTAGAQRLKNTLTAPDILLGDHLDLPSFLETNGSMVTLPDPASAAYPHQMLTFCLDKGIQKIYALRPGEQAALREAGLLFEEYGIEIVNG